MLISFISQRSIRFADFFFWFFLHDMPLSASNPTHKICRLTWTFQSLIDIHSRVTYWNFQIIFPNCERPIESCWIRWFWHFVYNLTMRCKANQFIVFVRLRFASGCQFLFSHAHFSTLHCWLLTDGYSMLTQLLILFRKCSWNWKWNGRWEKKKTR